ncbi:MAG: carboxypeptidase-like regulatory domain-containing protein [Terracidiphilus sp.]
MRLGLTKRLAGVAFAVLIAGALLSGWGGTLVSPPLARAQNIGQRVVTGTVLDGSSNSVSGATVFLKDLKSKTIRSFTSDPKGKFRFTQVDMAEDHELWAEKDGHKSAVKTVSEWDARKEFETELKLK